MKLFLLLKPKQINQPTKSLRRKKSGKLINYPSSKNSNILVCYKQHSKIAGLLCFTYNSMVSHRLAIPKCHFHIPHRYIFLLSGAVRRYFFRFCVPCLAIASNKTIPKVVVTDLAFRVLPFQICCFAFSIPGFTVPDLVFRDSVFHRSVFCYSWFHYMPKKNTFQLH